MPEIKGKPPSRKTQYYNLLMEGGRTQHLTGPELRVLFALFKFVDSKTLTCRPSVKTLAACVGANCLGHVFKSLATLTSERGFLETTKHGNKGRATHRRLVFPPPFSRRIEPDQIVKKRNRPERVKRKFIENGTIVRPSNYRPAVEPENGKSSSAVELQSSSTAELVIDKGIDQRNTKNRSVPENAN